MARTVTLSTQLDFRANSSLYKTTQYDSACVTAPNLYWYLLYILTGDGQPGLTLVGG